MYQYADKGKSQLELSRANTSVTNKSNVQAGTKMPVQTKSFFDFLRDAGSGKGQKVEQRLPTPAHAQPNNTGIPLQMKNKFENLSGFSFDDVRVHYNSDKPAQLQALAYTQGNQVYIGTGQENHLVHELGHVIQQKMGIVSPTEYLKGFYINTDNALEKEADDMPFQTDSALRQDRKPTNDVVQRITPEDLEELCQLISQIWFTQFNVSEALNVLETMYKLRLRSESKEVLSILNYADVFEILNNHVHAISGRGVTSVGDQNLQTATSAKHFGYEADPTALHLDKGIDTELKRRMLTEGKLMGVKETEDGFAPTSTRHVLPREENPRRSIFAFDHPYTHGKMDDAQDEVRGLTDSFFKAGKSENFGRMRMMVRAVDHGDKGTLRVYSLDQRKLGLYPYRVQRTAQTHHSTTMGEYKGRGIDPSQQSVLVKYGNFGVLFSDLFIISERLLRSGPPYNLPDDTRYADVLLDRIVEAVDGRRLPDGLHRKICELWSMMSKDIDWSPKDYQLICQIATIICEYSPDDEDYMRLFSKMGVIRKGKQIIKDASDGEDEFSDG